MKCLIQHSAFSIQHSAPRPSPSPSPLAPKKPLAPRPSPRPKKAPALAPKKNRPRPKSPRPIQTLGTSVHSMSILFHDIEVGAKALLRRNILELILGPPLVQSGVVAPMLRERSSAFRNSVRNRRLRPSTSKPSAATYTYPGWPQQRRCILSDFKETLLQISQRHSIELVVLEDISNSSSRTA